MREKVFVQFIFEPVYSQSAPMWLAELGSDFKVIHSSNHYKNYETHFIIEGIIDSVAATALKLSNPFLGERMRMSTISNELKNKYRK
jgi:hypothetical protein